LSSRKLGRGLKLKNRGALELTLRAGKVVRTPYFRLCYQAGEGPPGVAFLAGLRVGGAVKRNRAKWVLREAFRTSDMDLAGLETLVFIATDKAATARFADIEEALTAALHRTSDCAG